MTFSPFSLQTLINALHLEDSQQASQNSGGGSRLFGTGWGIKDTQVTVESVEAWGKLKYFPMFWHKVAEKYYRCIN